MLWLLIICILDILFCTRTVTDFRKFPWLPTKWSEKPNSNWIMGYGGLYSWLVPQK